MVAALGRKISRRLGCWLTCKSSGFSIGRFEGRGSGIPVVISCDRGLMPPRKFGVHTKFQNPGLIAVGVCVFYREKKRNCVCVCVCGLGLFS